MLEVTAVIPNFNAAARLARVLEALACQSMRLARVIVVDNGSSDDSVAVAQRAGAHVIALPTNTGFAHAVNRGVEEARTPWVALLNNDLWLSGNWLERLMEAAREHHAWFATGKILAADHPELLDGAFDEICRGACSWRAGHGRLDGPLWSRTQSIRFASFTAAIFRRELFAELGMLDERFESYLEDVDFGLRCAAAGRSGVYEPAAVAYHEGSATLGRWHPATVRRIARNQILLIAKHYPRRLITTQLWRICVAHVLWGMLAARNGHFLAWFRGKLEGLAAFRSLRPRDGEQAAGAGRALEPVLAESEARIREFQRQSGFDTYWRLYFALT